jgi:hypothetical protein
MNAAPDTVVLVHGLWMTPRSREGWVARYEAKVMRVLTSAYPGVAIEVESPRTSRRQPGTVTRSLRCDLEP